jgi:hypothetical protein
VALKTGIDKISRRIPPLVGRELLAYARQPWTYWLRSLATLGAVLVLIVMAATGHNRTGSTDGLPLFQGSVAVLFVIASLNGLRSASNCVGAERRQGTLTLLFLANLKLNTILVSKLVANSMRSAFALLGTLPVLGLCVLLGGVSGLVFVQGALAILATAWLSMMIGLDQSCRNQSEHEAFSHGVRQLLFWNVVPIISPLWLLFSAFGRRPTTFFYYWATLVALVAVGFFFLLRAKATLARNWREAPVEEGENEAMERLKAASTLPRLGHLKRPPRLCGNTPPALWLISRYGDARQVSSPTITVCFLVLIILMLLPAFFLGQFDSFAYVYLVVMGACRLVQLLAMAKIAPQSFGDVARHGALEILQTTPVTLKDLVRAAERFLLTQFGKGIIPILVMDALVAFLLQFKQGWSRETVRFVLLLLGINSFFLPALLAMASTGIWLGIKQRSLARASFSTVAYLVLLPGALCLIQAGSPGILLVGLAIAYGAVALVMHQKLRQLAQGGDQLQRLLQRGD